ncbi:MAG: hypothetical protein IJW82_06070 [Clostridia bacterium]|nr:hypothetical protein [Clostridia bacterium]
MKERILGYVKDIDEKLQNLKDVKDIDGLIKEHLIQISFFQHERLVHLFVMLAFVFLCLTTIIVSITQTSLVFSLISLILLVVLVFYILHYFLLENKVQYMYTQYDKMLIEKKERENNK